MWPFLNTIFKFWHPTWETTCWGRSKVLWEKKRPRQTQVWTQPCWVWRGVCVRVCVCVRERGQVNNLPRVAGWTERTLLHHEINHTCVWAGLHCIISASFLSVVAGCSDASQLSGSVRMYGCNQTRYKCWCVPAGTRSSGKNKKRRKCEEREQERWMWMMEGERLHVLSCGLWKTLSACKERTQKNKSQKRSNKNNPQVPTEHDLMSGKATIKT